MIPTPFPPPPAKVHHVSFPFPFTRLGQEQNFLSKILPPNESGCRLWSGMSQDNAGMIRLNGKELRAHRVAYMYFHGEIPPLHQIHQTCGNKFCLTKEHLKLVPNPTKKERPPPKARGGQSKFTAEQIQEIRKQRSSGRTFASIALDFSCTPMTIYNICTGKTHTNIPFNPEHKPQEIL